ncbi:MAG TPA: SH3 domain-containing protein [Spirochaetota bacterium]|nr:SH3 domain-containing protein [Spirochaetota bacterium]
MSAYRVLILAAIVAASLLPAGCGDNGRNEKSRPERISEYAVVVSDNTALRIDPMIYSARITLMRKGTRLAVLDQSKEKSWVGKDHGFWYKVRLENGLTGWAYGSTIRIFAGSQSGSIDGYVSNLREHEEETLRKDLSGKWWSVNKSGDFTNLCVEIYENGKYKSYARGGKEIEGEYNFNFNDETIVFLSGTSFGQNLKYVNRGNMYHLETRDGKYDIRFKKITEGMAEPPPEDEAEAASPPVPPKEEDGKASN